MTFIQIQNDDCVKQGFVNMNFTIKKKVTGWEKAMYYFSIVNTSYKDIWFVEDDVFFYNEQTLLNIDTNYKDGDLLSNTYKENATGEKDSWNWKYIQIEIPPPYFSAMVCAVRISNLLLKKIKEYANTYNTLFFLEALFPTLCKTNQLIYHTPKELRTILYRKNYSWNDCTISNLYHPLKDIHRHRIYRKKLNSKK